jgi:hypothetical protein
MTAVRKISVANQTRSGGTDDNRTVRISVRTSSSIAQQTVTVRTRCTADSNGRLYGLITTCNYSMDAWIELFFSGWNFLEQSTV